MTKIDITPKEIKDIFRLGIPTEFIADIAEWAVKLVVEAIKYQVDVAKVTKLSGLKEYLSNEDNKKKLITIFHELKLDSKLYKKDGEIKDVTDKKAAKILVKGIFTNYINSLDDLPKFEDSTTFSGITDGTEKENIKTIYKLCIEGMKRKCFSRLDSSDRIIIKLINDEIKNSGTEIADAVKQTVIEALASVQQMNCSVTEIANLTEKDIANPYIWVKRKCPHCGYEGRDLHYDKKLQTVFCGDCGRTYDVIYDVANENEDLKNWLKDQLEANQTALQEGQTAILDGQTALQEGQKVLKKWLEVKVNELNVNDNNIMNEVKDSAKMILSQQLTIEYFNNYCEEQDEFQKRMEKIVVSTMYNTEIFIKDNKELLKNTDEIKQLVTSGFYTMQNTLEKIFAQYQNLQPLMDKMLAQFLGQINKFKNTVPETINCPFCGQKKAKVIGTSGGGKCNCCGNNFKEEQLELFRDDIIQDIAADKTAFEKEYTNITYEYSINTDTGKAELIKNNDEISVLEPIKRIVIKGQKDDEVLSNAFDRSTYLFNKESIVILQNFSGLTVNPFDVKIKRLIIKKQYNSLYWSNAPSVAEEVYFDEGLVKVN